MSKLKNRLSYKPEYNCTFSSVLSCIKYIEKDLDVTASDLYILGGGIESLQYNTETKKIGNGNMFLVIQNGLRAYGIEFGLSVRDKNIKEPMQVWYEDDRFLKKDIPVIVSVHVNYLKYHEYYSNQFAVDQELQGHNIILTGIDFEKQTVQMADVFINTNPIETYEGELQLKELTEGRRRENFASHYLDFNNLKNQAVDREQAFVDSMNRYYTQQSPFMMLAGVYEDIKNAHLHYDYKSLTDYIKNLYFYIKLNGVILQKIFINQYLEKLQTGSRHSNTTELIDINREIVLIWNKVLVNLIRWNSTKETIFQDKILMFLNQIQDQEKNYYGKLRGIT